MESSSSAGSSGTIDKHNQLPQSGTGINYLDLIRRSRKHFLCFFCSLPLPPDYIDGAFLQNDGTTASSSTSTTETHNASSESPSRDSEAYNILCDIFEVKWKECPFLKEVQFDRRNLFPLCRECQGRYQKMVEIYVQISELKTQMNKCIHVLIERIKSNEFDEKVLDEDKIPQLEDKTPQLAMNKDATLYQEMEQIENQNKRLKLEMNEHLQFIRGKIEVTQSGGGLEKTTPTQLAVVCSDEFRKTGLSPSANFTNEDANLHHLQQCGKDSIDHGSSSFESKRELENVMHKSGKNTFKPHDSLAADFPLAAKNRENVSCKFANDGGFLDVTPGFTQETLTISATFLQVTSSTLKVNLPAKCMEIDSSSSAFTSHSGSDLATRSNMVPNNLATTSRILASQKGDDVIADTKIDDNDEGCNGLVSKKKRNRSQVHIPEYITIIGENPAIYQCNVCNKSFKTKANIKYHGACVNGNKPFKCVQCGKGFIVKSHYEYHQRTHTGVRPYKCPECGKGFNQRGKVTRHMRSHTGEKPFICQECKRGFSNKQALRSHALIHTGERPFACTYCDKRFTGRPNLTKHSITHTGERPFKCEYCGKCFGLKNSLDIHLKTHSGERPYQCKKCLKAFSNDKDLRRHLIIHTGQRPFQCSICGTSFVRKDNLDRHLRTRHGKPKAEAKELADEAAVQYLRKSSPGLGDISFSRVNSAVISNIIKKAGLMTAGGIEPNNLHHNSKQHKGHETKEVTNGISNGGTDKFINKAAKKLCNDAPGNLATEDTAAEDLEHEETTKNPCLVLIS